jgi:hypothetical protein
MAQQVEPIIVSGGQGGGKTTYLREMHDRFDGPSIFLTTKRYERKAISSPPQRIRRSSSRYPEDIQKARQWARAHDETVQLIVDECQNAPTFIDGDGPVREMLHEDREAGVKTVISTQSPSDLRTDKRNYAPVQQCDWWVWVGPLKTWHSGFFNANGMGDMKPLMPTQKYRYVVFAPIESYAPKERIQCRGETKKAYG